MRILNFYKKLDLFVTFYQESFTIYRYKAIQKIISYFFFFFFQRKNTQPDTLASIKDYFSNSLFTSVLDFKNSPLDKLFADKKNCFAEINQFCKFHVGIYCLQNRWWDLRIQVISLFFLNVLKYKRDAIFDWVRNKKNESRTKFLSKIWKVNFFLKIIFGV